MIIIRGDVRAVLHDGIPEALARDDDELIEKPRRIGGEEDAGYLRRYHGLNNDGRFFRIRERHAVRFGVLRSAFFIAIAHTLDRLRNITARNVQERIELPGKGVRRGILGVERGADSKTLRPGKIEADGVISSKHGEFRHRKAVRAHAREIVCLHGQILPTMRKTTIVAIMVSSCR